MPQVRMDEAWCNLSALCLEWTEQSRDYLFHDADNFVLRWKH